MTNVSNLSFATHEGIYLAGAALAVRSKSGKIGFIGDKSDPSAARYASVFIKGAAAGNSKVKVSSKLLDTNFENEIKAQVNAGIDQIFSTWSKSDAVISNIASLNRLTTPILISGLLPEQYFLNFSAGKKNQYLVVQKRFDLAVEQIITAELADKNILEILDGNKGIYGHRYNLKDGGVTVKVVSGAAFSSRIQAISANLKAGRIKNLLGS
jgi:basic membrane protein A